MKTNTAIVAILIAVLNAFLLLPMGQLYGSYLVAATIALSLWLFFKAIVGKSPTPVAPEPIEPAPPATRAEPERVRPTEPTRDLDAEVARRAEAQVVAALGVFQSKGRFVDFLKDDVTAYSDAQVGAAARVVHQGCREALDELLAVEPVSTEAEGSTVSVPEGAADDYRLVGKVSGAPPFRGKLTHKGWKATRVNLPRALPGADKRLPPIAPAQVEVAG